MKSPAPVNVIGTWLYFNGTIGAVGKRLAASPDVAGSNPIRNKYLCGLQVVVLGLAVCVLMFVNASTIQVNSLG